MTRSQLSRLVQTLALACLFQAGPALAADMIPNFYEEPGLSPNRDYVNQAVNEHIDPFTGKLQLHSVDLFLPGNGGLDIKVQRSYNSVDSFVSALPEPTVTGLGWTMHFGRVIRRAIIDICATNTLVGNAPVLELPDGSRQILYLNPSWTAVISTNRWTATCVPGGLNILSPDGTVYEMTTSGMVASIGATVRNAYYTTRIVDRNGNSLNFSYVNVASGSTVSQITSSDGRVVNFAYTGNSLSSVSDNAGRTWTYEYVTSGMGLPLLTKVIRPDGASWQYDYELGGTISDPGAFALTKLTYPTGGTVDYSYGFAQFNYNLPKTTVVSRKVGMGGTWLYSYNPAARMGSLDAAGYSFPDDDMMDRTYVVGPDGVQLYMHVGANSINSGAVWAIGLLLYKSIDGGYEQEGRSWNYQVISNSINRRPGAIWITDGAIAAPIMDRRVVVRNGQGFSTDFSDFDAFGNPQTIAESGTDTRTTTVAYANFPGKWILHMPSSQTVSTIGTTTWTYDDNANRLSETKYGVQTRFTYTGQGDIASKTDARSNTISYGSYFRGIPLAETHPEGVSISRVVDLAGNISRQTDGVGATTNYSYDGLNRLTHIGHPIGNPVSISWTPFQRQVQRGSYVETTKFDGYGRVARTTVDGGSGGSITQTHLYDPLGRKIFSSYFNSPFGTYTEYDVLGRPYAVYHVAQAVGSYIGGGHASHSLSPTSHLWTIGSYTGGKRTSYFGGNSVLNTNERNFAYRMDYRAYGNPDGMELVAIQAPDLSANVVLTLNGLGQPLTIQQAGVTRSNIYDSRYFLTSATNPETGTSVFGRDAVGNMTSRQVGGSGTTLFTYDGRNRLVFVAYPAGTPSISKVYLQDDTLSRVDNGQARREYTYTANKKLQRETLQVDDNTYAVDYAYNGNDALANMAYSTGLTVSYAPDGLGRPTQAMPFASSVSFHPGGLPSQIRYANGVISNFGLNDRQWPVTLNTKASSGADLANLTQSYDLGGNVTGVTESVAGLQNRSFGYDSIDRLTNLDIPAAGVIGGLIGYDGRGNIIGKQYGSFAMNYNYDASNRLQTISGSRAMAFSYDAYGNVSGNSRNTFQYNDALNLKCSDCGTPSETDHVYDGAGTRVKTQTPTMTTYYMYAQGGDLLFDVDSAGIKREYGYVAGRNIAKKESN